MNLLATLNHSLLTPSQVYLGFTMDDALRLVRYRAAGAVPKAGFFTDYFGIRTQLTNFMEDPGSLDAAVGPFPFPNDGLHSELVEYLGTVKAIEGSGDTVTVVEMGAGYAPWLVFSGTVARQRGATRIQLVAVEAETRRHQLIRNHFRENGFPQPGEPADGVSTAIIHGAISNERGTISFGSADIFDWGGAVQQEAGKDYRGAEVTHEEVPAILMSDVLDGLDSVDLLHIDIQGWEAKALRASLASVCAKVRYMVIGTHSRVIEGELMDLLRASGWVLMHEKPCQFDYIDVPELSGATTVDGAQVWANATLGADPGVPAELTEAEQALVEKTKATVGVQHVIAKEYVWTLTDRIAELEEALREASKPLYRRAIERLGLLPVARRVKRHGLDAGGAVRKILTR